MKIIYKCQYTGKEFDTSEDCEVHEYEHGGERQKFFDLVDEFIVKLEEKYPNIVVKKESLKKDDTKEFYIRDRIVRDRYIIFNFTIDGEEKEYHRYSDEVGDCRWDWRIKDTVEDLILNFEKEFIYPKMTVFEGVLKTEWEDVGDYVTKFEELERDYFLNLLENKKIRIEILEDYNAYDEDE